MDDICAQVRCCGVAEAAGCGSLPTTSEAQWALLAPFVGRPVWDVPASLVLLFTATTGPQGQEGYDKVAPWLLQHLQALPQEEWMVLPAGVDTACFL